MLSQTIIDTDPYTRPAFSLGNKIKRLLWKSTWLLICSWTPVPFHRWRVFVLRIFGAKIGHTNSIYPDCKIWAPWLLETQDLVTIGPGAEIYNPGGAFLGHHVIISQSAYLCGATHDYNNLNFNYLTKKISLAPYTWICARAMVLPGVKCGEGSVLGAGSITSRNLDPWKVYAGNPAQLVKNRINFILNT